MEPRIREATAGDIAAMHAIRLAVRENRLSDPEWRTPEVYRSCLADAGTANTWVCETTLGIVGFATGRREQQDIWALFVDPSHEGCGVGGLLLEIATEWLFDQGVEAIQLGTSPDTSADEFYRRKGWQRGEMTGKNEVMYRLPHPAARAPTNQENETC